ncbi:Cd2+/Zn2+-exporting ATPase [Desulfitispora alkaliphila]|uniref:heavy metal translocating P-type ATPase n=1 Tax=Desulfitispora alkaliphila TaxID=622674 RepID=UPI003D1E40A0
MSSTVENDVDTSTFYVAGIDCPDCAGKLKRALEQTPGVKKVELNFALGKVKLEHNLKEDVVVGLIEKQGYRVLSNSGPKSQGILKIGGAKLAIISAILLFTGVLLEYVSQVPSEIVKVVLLGAIAVGGYPTFKKGLTSLVKLSFDMNVLMTIAVIGALAIGEWVEGAVIAFLFVLSSTLEAYSLDKTRASIKKLMELVPATATVKELFGERVKPVEEVRVGETILVKPGEKIPLDGEVVGGSSWVDEAPITGESTPKSKREGETVFAGSLNQAGYLEIKVSKIASENTLAKIIKLVEEAQDKQAPTQKFIDRFAAVYTPAVLILAALLVVIPTVFMGEAAGTWIYRALALLLIACPCALVIATPVSMVTAMGTGAREGVLIKGGLHLERAEKITTMAFDKTGTLTKGKPTVTSIKSFDNKVQEAELLELAASLEKKSEHPLALAICQSAQERGVKLTEIEDFTVHPGEGVAGIINGEKIFLGKRDFVERVCTWKDANVASYFQEEEDNGKTVIIVGTANKPLGAIALEDQVREDAADALKQLKTAGINRIVMLTGDNKAVAERVGKALGVDKVWAGVLPQDKLYIIERLGMDKTVAMVGDGINDAPALARADVGIAMGVAGTDTALETADVALMADDLKKLPLMIKLSKKTMKIIKQNIILALGLKLAAIILVFPGYLTLWMAVLADMGASLLVIANGLRLLRIE